MDIVEKKYFSIGQVSRITGVKPYVLRYWESEFKLLRPARRESGQRKYTQEDLKLIERIKELLYIKKFSIAGAKKFLLEDKRKKERQVELDFKKDSAAIQVLKEIKKEIKDIIKTLDKE